MSQPAKLPLVVEPSELEKVLGDQELLIIDLCNPNLYAQAHVPGAINVAPNRMVSGVQPAPGKLPPLEQLNQLFSDIGYSPEKHIVVYDDEGGGWAGRFIWTLDVIGHQHYSYLNGGAHAWLKEGYRTENKLVTPAPNPVSLSINHHFIASKEFIMAALDSDDLQIWDARSPEEYAGLRVLAQKAGHIPGAINFEWTRGMDLSRNLRIRDDLDTELANLGFDKNKTLVTHCQTHHRSGFTYLIAKTLGYRVKAYDGSWSEWGNSPETPATIS